jgi:CDGSH-type Zn-finger protein/uncharacterized Fe-S cluster protein YjdI
MANPAKAYEGEDITVTYSARRCIHAAECVHGLGAVFGPERRPWIAPDAAPADQLAEVILRCPSGALHFRRKDGGAEEAIPAANTVTVGPDGPLYLRGNLDVEMPDGATHPDTRAALCRCGASANKPFCDNSHLTVEFKNDAVFQKVVVKSAEDGADGPLTVTPSRNGPYLLQGPFELIGAEASVRGIRATLCRCGGSANKPFCDGTHNKIGFRG